MRVLPHHSESYCGVSLDKHDLSHLSIGIHLTHSNADCAVVGKGISSPASCICVIVELVNFRPVICFVVNFQSA